MSAQNKIKKLTGIGRKRGKFRTWGSPLPETGSFRCRMTLIKKEPRKIVTLGGYKIEKPNERGGKVIKKSGPRGRKP